MSNPTDDVRAFETSVASPGEVPVQPETPPKECEDDGPPRGGQPIERVIFRYVFLQAEKPAR
jgi:hypothetical protein